MTFDQNLDADLGDKISSDENAEKDKMNKTLGARSIQKKSASKIQAKIDPNSLYFKMVTDQDARAKIVKNRIVKNPPKVN